MFESSKRRFHQTTPLLWFCILTFTTGEVLFGLDTSLFGSLQALPSFLTSFGVETNGVYALPTSRKSLMNSLVWVGRLAGTTTFEPIVTRIGYKKLVIMIGIIQIIAVIIQMATTNWIVFTVGRVLGYAAVALAENAVPAYSAEVAPPDVRGFFGGMLIVFNTIGGIWGSAMSRAFVTETGKRGWLIPVGVQFIPGVLLVTLTPFCIESPRWLIEKDRVEEALTELKRVRRREDIQAGLPELEIQLLHEAIEVDKNQHTASWLDLFRGSYLSRSITVIVLFFSYQWGGNQFWASYGPTFLQAHNYGDKTFTYSVVVQGVSASGVILAVLTTDIVGRRWLVLPSGLLIILCEFLIGGLADKQPRTTAANNTVVAAFVLMFWALKLGWQTHAYLMTSELGGLRMRKKMLTLGTTVDVFFAFAISFSFPYLLGTPGANLGSKVGYICGGLALAGWIHNFFFLPDLARRGLEEVDEMYQEFHWGWQYKKIVTSGVGAKVANLEMGRTFAMDKPTDEDRKTANAVHLEDGHPAPRP